MRLANSAQNGSRDFFEIRWGSGVALAHFALKKAQQILNLKDTLFLQQCVLSYKYIYIIDKYSPRWYNRHNPIESGRETDLMTPQQPKNIKLGANFRNATSVERWDGERLLMRLVRARRYFLRQSNTRR